MRHATYGRFPQTQAAAWNEVSNAWRIDALVVLRVGPYFKIMATYDDLPRGEPPIAPLSSGEIVQVYFWTKRDWLVGRYFVDALGRAFVIVPGCPPLRYEAAQLMGLRRLVH